VHYVGHTVSLKNAWSLQHKICILYSFTQENCLGILRMLALNIVALDFRGILILYIILNDCCVNIPTCTYIYVYSVNLKFKISVMHRSLAKQDKFNEVLI
jgi:hypothetical protein